MSEKYRLSYSVEDIDKKLSVISTPATIKPTIDPVFANNSWDTIAWVAKYDDPSKYWRVGDYKILTIPGGTVNNFFVYRSYNSDMTYQFSMPYVSLGSNTTKIGTVEIINPQLFNTKINALNTITGIEYDSMDIHFTTNTSNKIILQFRYLKTNENGVATIQKGWTQQSPRPTIEQFETDYGVKITFDSTYTSGAIRGRGGYITMINKTITLPNQEYPIMIVGINQDDVSTPYDYGKTKAGLTLDIGVTRAVVEYAPPFNHTEALQYNIYDRAFYSDGNGNLIQFPYITEDGTKVLSPYKFCNANQTQSWGETQLRSALQNIFNGTEIADLLVSVEKTTGVGVVKPAYNYTPSDFSYDKVFLPSEYELNGMTIYYTGDYNSSDIAVSVSKSLFPEGKTYDFFDKKYSRFYWDKEFLNDRINVKEVHMLTRSKPRMASNTEVDANAGCCYLNCKGNSYKNNGAAEKIPTLSIVRSSEFSPDRFLKEINLGTLTPEGQYRIYIEYENEEDKITIEKDGIVVSGPYYTKTDYQNYDLHGIIFNGTSGHPTIKTTAYVFNIAAPSTVSYGPGAGDVEGYILPMFCM